MNDEPGAGFDDVLTWRERRDEALVELGICMSLYFGRLERDTDLMIENSIDWNNYWQQRGG